MQAKIHLPMLIAKVSFFKKKKTFCNIFFHFLLKTFKKCDRSTFMTHKMYSQFTLLIIKKHCYS